MGSSGRSYAIPTMQGGVETIKPYVDEFVAFAREHPLRASGKKTSRPYLTMH